MPNYNQVNIKLKLRKITIYLWKLEAEKLFLLSEKLLSREQLTKKDEASLASLEHAKKCNHDLFVRYENGGISIREAVMQLINNKKLFDHCLLKKLKTGHCSGFAQIFLISKWLKYQPKTGQERDDSEWFFQTLKKIDGFNVGDELTEEDASNIERFLSLLRFQQDPSAALLFYSQGDMQKSVELLVKHSICAPKQQYSLAGCFNISALDELLKQIVIPNKLILLRSHDHDVAIFQDDNNVIWLYDPNNKEGEVATYSLAMDVFNAFKYGYKYGKLGECPLGVRIFGFEEDNYYMNLSRAALLKNATAAPRFPSQFNSPVLIFLNCCESQRFFSQRQSEVKTSGATTDATSQESEAKASRPQ